jgi:hypothetical protein
VTAEALKVRIIESRRPASSLRGKEVIKTGRLTDKKAVNGSQESQGNGSPQYQLGCLLKKMRLVSVKTKKKGSVDVI